MAASSRSLPLSALTRCLEEEAAAIAASAHRLDGQQVESALSLLDRCAETRAKPEIWSDAAGFKKVMDGFQAESAKMVQVAKTAKDVDAVRGQFAALGKSCAACHDNFRTK